jgi:hypothetical protein
MNSTHYRADSVQRIGAFRIRIDAVLAVDEMAVEVVLDVKLTALVTGAEHARAVGLVEGEQQGCAGRGIKEARPEPVGDGDVRQRLDHGIITTETDKPASGRAGVNESAPLLSLRDF